MRLLTNPGSNLSDELIRRYRVTVLPQRITVDGVAHDTRQPISHEEVDRWVKSAARWPTAIGTTAGETLLALQEAVKDGDREIIIVTTSKKIINSYQGAEVAVRTFAATPQGQGVKIAVIDSTVTDIGAGLCCVLAGEAIKAGLPFEEVVRVVTAATAQQRMGVAIGTLENLVKGGRASFLRAFVADVLGKRPMIGFDDGAMTAVATWSRRGDMLEQLREWIVGQLPGKPRVLLGLGHTNEIALARRLRELMKDDFDIVATLHRPVSSGVYLHAGPGALSATVMPVGGLKWLPSTLEL